MNEMKWTSVKDYYPGRDKTKLLLLLANSQVYLWHGSVDEESKFMCANGSAYPVTHWMEILSPYEDKIIKI